MLASNIITALAATVNLEVEEADVEAAEGVAADVGVALDLDDHLGGNLDVAADVAAGVPVDDFGIA